MRFEAFSPKQRRALTWWCPRSRWSARDAVICDGAVRSGKTLCLSLSFVAWAMARFSGQSFGLCGKTITSLRRNLLLPLLDTLRGLGFHYKYTVSDNILVVNTRGRENRFYLFGGKDEGSAALIQGVTLAGALLDEVALMPRSFVEQAIARCSVSGSKLWFSCNPGHPGHWFHTEWILKAEQKNALYIHFEMRDNPSLSARMLKRYESLYSGAFYERFVLGKWVAAQGAVYPMFSREKHVVSEAPQCSRFVISCDYGTRNPASFGLWGEHEGVWFRLREYYHSGRDTGELKTDEEYCLALEELAVGAEIEAVVADPSAASFIEAVRRRGRFRVVPADNAVADGIRTVSAALRSNKLMFCECCENAIREFGLYRWEESSSDDRPRKEDDHAMDDIRYFCAYAFGPPTSGCAVRVVDRK